MVQTYLPQTAKDLSDARKLTSFPVEALTNFLHGGANIVKRQHGVLEIVKNEHIFRKNDW